jgi:hypothetical protein
LQNTVLEHRCTELGALLREHQQLPGKVFQQHIDLAVRAHSYLPEGHHVEAFFKVGICVRNLNESHKGIRKFISTFGNWLVQTLIVPGIKDTQCGFKVFEADAAREIFGRQRIVGWGFDMEVLAIARKLGYSIELIEVPDWRDVVEGSKISGNGAMKVALQTFSDLLKIKWGLITGKYKKVSFRYVPYKN